MRQIIAMGGGGFSMEPENLLLDQYVLDQVNKELPKICFVPTASGDQANYIEAFYEAFNKLPCQPTHISLFEPNFDDLENFILNQDIIYVGAGNTRNMLLLWKDSGLDTAMKKAYENGTILCGMSAGAICWFEEGLTDPINAPLHKIKGLDLIKGSNCPHYGGENKRKPAYHHLILKGEMKEGYGVDDGAALHFIDEALIRTVSSRPEAKAYAVQNENEELVETEIETAFLGD